MKNKYRVWLDLSVSDDFPVIPSNDDDEDVFEISVLVEAETKDEARTLAAYKVTQNYQASMEDALDGIYQVDLLEIR